MLKELYYTEEQTKDFATILSMKEIKRTIIVDLGEIAFKKWSPLGRWGKGEINGREVWGVMDYDQSGNLYWSHFNRLNTNRTGLTHLKNKINQLLIDRGINDSITFKDNFYLKSNNHHYLFSTQPCIWKKEVLLILWMKTEQSKQMQK